MTDHQTETQRSLSWLEKKQAREEKGEIRAESFVISGIRDYSEALSHFTVTVSPTQIALFEKDSLLSGVDKEIAEVLSEVEVVDPYFSNLDISKPQDLTDAAGLTVAKAKALGREINDPKVKKELDRFEEKVLRGVGGFLAGRRKKTMAVTSALVLIATASCARFISPESTSLPSPTEPVITEVAQIPTASPEAISSFNESAQKIVDEAFKGLGVHDINIVGAGILADPEGREYALFTSILPDKNNATDLDFLLIGEVGTDNHVENIKGLVLDEEQQGSVLEFIAVSFNPDTETFAIEGPFMRTNTQTGEIEIFNNGSWQFLEGPERTINDVKQRLGHGVLAATALPTPTPEVSGPSAQELRQILVGQGFEVETKELEDGTEIVVRESEWSMDVLSAVWAEGINPQDNVELVVSDDGKDATLIFHQEQILAFSDENYGSFLTQDGQITTWRRTESLQVELPEGTAEISFFDRHNGEWYAIDVHGRAVVKLNEAGEWEKYERPVKIARWELIQEPPPFDITEELNPKEISRLIGDEGEIIPYGYLFERSASYNSHVFVSGYPLGMFVRETPRRRQPIMAFEIPLRYHRQILFFMIPDQTNSFSNLCFIPTSRNINERRRRPKSFHELGLALSRPEAVGNQMIFAFQTRYKDDSLMSKYNVVLEKLKTAFKEGEGASLDIDLIFSYFWVNESLFGH